MKATLTDLELELWLRSREKGEILWTTKEGNKIPINEMSDEHLLNTIHFLKRLIREVSKHRDPLFL